MTAKQSAQSKSVWWKKLIATIALINLFLVIFDFSYLPLRDFYLRYTPTLAKTYDLVKGVEPHPDTTAYLQTVDNLQASIEKELSTVSTEQLLSSLRQQSIALIEENPFLTANKSSTFAKLKHRIEYHLQTRSAKEAFTRFWSQEYLSGKKQTELAFFEEKIEPLLRVNYYRRSDANGLYIDHFWRIDIFFIAFFAVEYLCITFWLAKNRNDLNWRDAMLRHWYDVLMLIPLWRWLRIIPVTVRIHKSGLLNMERILSQITHEPAAYISHRASMFLVVRLLNQSQEAIDNGAIASVLSSSTKTLSVTEEKVNLIIDRLVGLAIYDVLPEVKPDIEDLLRHILRGALTESDVYKTLKTIPGMANIPQDGIEQLADYLSQAAYDVLNNSYADTEGKVIFERFTDNFAANLKHQLQNKATQSEIQAMLLDLLEEWKSSYVKASHQRDPQDTLAETEEITRSVS